MIAFTLWPRTWAWPARRRPPPRRRATRPASRRPPRDVGSVTNARPSSVLRPGSPTHAPARSSTATPRRAGAPLPLRRRSTVDLGDELVALAARRDAGRRSERLGEPIGERPELEEVEQPLDLVRLRARPPATRSRRRRAARRGGAPSGRGSCGCAPRWRRGSRGASGVCLSTLAKIPSSPPYWLISLAAVFSPTPGTPGRLSLGSPRSAAYCGYSAGRTPVFSSMPASSYSA